MDGTPRAAAGAPRARPGFLHGRAAAAAMLVATAAIWGSTFLVQKEGAEHIGPFAFTCFRGFLGSAFLFLVLRGRDALGIPRPHGGDPAARRATLAGGVACGAALCLASSLQQLGVADTTPGVCAFLTGTYVLLVPLCGLFSGRPPRAWVWVGVAVCAVGLFFICIDPSRDSFRLGRGETFTLACAAAFTMHILLAERYSPRADVIAMCAVQLLCSALFALPFLTLRSEAAMLGAASLRACAPALLWTGVMSSGIAYTMQVAAQGRLAAPVAALIMSLETVFALLCQFAFMPEVRQTPRQLVGCALMFAAVAGVQLAEAARRD